MLLQFSVENFKSISNQIVFSMLKTNDNLHADYIRKDGNYRVLPNSFIIGTNGAGKSNLFKAILYLQNLLTNQNEIRGFPHKLSKKDEPTKIDLQFVVDDIRYAYGIDVLDNKVVYEYLTLYQDDEEKMIFERNQGSYKYVNSKLKENFPENQVCLSFLYNQTQNKYIKKAFYFMTEKIQVILSDQETTLFKNAVTIFKKTQNQKIVNQLIHVLDIGIKRFYLDQNDTFVSYENMEMNILEESEGTKKLFIILVMLSDVLLNGKILFFDELEKNLHLTLVKHMVYLFNKPMSNNQNAQLIFSTHNTSLLNLSTFRRDQVWFMEKNFETMATELYSLYNIINVQDHEDIERGYISGKYGATFRFSHDEVHLDGN